MTGGWSRHGRVTGMAPVADVAAFTAALDHHSFAAQVAADQATAAELDIGGTPTFIVNGKRMTGDGGVRKMRDMVDQALAER